MRLASLVVLLGALCGCRELLGIEQAQTLEPDAASSAPDAVPVDAPPWACGGEMPSAPPSTVVYATTLNGQTLKITLMNTSIDGQGALATVRPGTEITVTSVLAISNCLDIVEADQLRVEVGFLANASPSACISNAGNPAGADCETGTTEAKSIVVTAPDQPGVYAFGFALGLGQAASCGGGVTWSQGSPPPEQIVAQICVH